jgi:hypothetical protein
VGALEKSLEEKGGEDSGSPFPFPSTFRRKPTGRLAKIKLPPGPTKDQVREYVRKIVDASRGQRMFSDSDPQIGMLRKVGSEHIDVLIHALEERGIGMSNYHLIRAVKALVKEKDLPLIREALPVYKELVKVVIAKGWEKEVRNTLVEELQCASGFLPTEWIEAVANLQDPSTYGDLLRYLATGMNPSHTYKALEKITDLPPDELEDAVDKAWDRMKSSGSGFHGSEWQKNAVAKIAARHGHVDALGHLIRRLNQAKKDPYSGLSEVRGQVFRLVPFRGSNKELLEWFTKNEDRLGFDKAKRQFFVPEAGKKPEEEGDDEGDF